MWKTAHTYLPAYKNQDRLFIKQTDEGALVAIFDGHGSSDETVELCATVFKKILTENTATFGAPEQVLHDAFKHVAEATSHTKGGSTALVGILSSNGNCTFATLGDSIHIALLGKKLFVGPHHNIWSNTNERAQAVSRGGIYRGDRYIYSSDERFGLQCSRSFGDTPMGAVVSKEPEITSLVVPLGGFVALMSDGVLDPADAEGEFEHDLQLLTIVFEYKKDPKRIMRRFQERRRDDASLIACYRTH